MPRRDEQIGLQELIAIPLAYWTFRHLVAEALITVACDNQGVLHALVQGRAAAEDANRAIGLIWLDVAELGIAMHVVRVESHANLADGPSRDSLDRMLARDASFHEPQLPAWLWSIWDV